MSTPTTETLTVTVERDMPYPPDKIWRALTQPQLMDQWLMKSDSFEPVVGHQFHFREDWGTLACEVLTVEPNRQLSYTWNYGNENPAFDMKSVVLWTLTPTSTGTHLRMDHSGFRPDQPQAYNGAKCGWQKFIGNLEQLLAK